MSRIQGVSGTGAMPKSCSMRSMHNNSMMKLQEESQTKTKEQTLDNQPKTYNPNVGMKVDVRI